VSAKLKKAINDYIQSLIALKEAIREEGIEQVPSSVSAEYINDIQEILRKERVG